MTRICICSKINLKFEANKLHNLNPSQYLSGKKVLWGRHCPTFLEDRELLLKWLSLLCPYQSILESWRVRLSATFSTVWKKSSLLGRTQDHRETIWEQIHGRNNYLFRDLFCKVKQDLCDCLGSTRGRKPVAEKMEYFCISSSCHLYHPYSRKSFIFAFRSESEPKHWSGEKGCGSPFWWC